MNAWVFGCFLLLFDPGVDCFNFERVFDEYTSWVGRDNTTGPSGRAVNRASSVVDRQDSKGTVLIAWERLMQQDLLTAMETSGAPPVRPLIEIVCGTAKS